MQRLLRIINFTGQYKKHLFGAMFFAMLSAIWMLIPYFSIYQLIQLSLQGPVLRANLMHYGSIAVIGILLDVLTFFIALWLSHMAGFRLERNMRSYGVNRLLTVGLRFFDQEESGAIRKTIDDNASLTHTFVAHNIPDTIRSIVAPTLILISIFYINWLYGVLMLLIVATSLFLLNRMMGNTADIRQYMDSLDEMTATSTEFVRGMALVKLFDVPLTVFKRFKQSITHYGEWALNYSLSVRQPYISNQIVLEAFPILLIFALRWQNAISAQFTLALFALIISVQIVMLLMKVLTIGQSLYMSVQAVDRIDHMFNGYEENIESTMATAPSQVDFANQDLVANNIGFAYLKDQPILHDISFKLPHQKMTVIVGASGSGKSTIAKLLIGAYRNYSGAITIGNQDIKKLSEPQLMANITYISQHSRLFNRSILDNLKIANPFATAQQIQQALKWSACDDLVVKLPQGINTVIGQDGVHLSGGEQQRLTLCQAFLREAQIVILDEVTASIDAENENQMQAAIIQLAKEKTVILIDHKLKITKYADQILVFHHGQIVERGTHTALLAKSGQYQMMLDMHLQTQNWRLGAES